MEITHRTNNLRIAPRKLRLVADKIRYQNASHALQLLPLIVNKGAGMLYKSLKSAVQVAEDNDLDTTQLIIQRIWCDEGKPLKRMIGHSRGRMAQIMKQSSHVSIVLKGEPKVKAKRKTAVAEEK
jgi:large subunit ribosomal protein L22